MIEVAKSPNLINLFKRRGKKRSATLTLNSKYNILFFMNVERLSTFIGILNEIIEVVGAKHASRGTI